MRWSTACAAFVVLLAFDRVASAGTVRDEAGDIAIALDEPAASICVGLPARPTDDGTCTANDRAVATSVAAASGQGRGPIGLVIAHFEA